MGYWYTENAGSENIAVSTRIRLARNIKGLPFPFKMSEEQKEELINTVKPILSKEGAEELNSYNFILMDDVPENERYAMVERHIISREFVKNPNGKAIIISPDESVCIMLGEEDHIRIQVIKSGFCPDECLETANKIDNVILKNLPIAYDEKLGFLTECPTNLGTGLRASVMLHLPIMKSGGEISAIGQSVNKIGFTVRGMYGEGSKSISSFYQISNQITLGISEADAISSLKAITNQLIEREKLLRKGLNTIRIGDKAYRALYTLKGAKILDSREMSTLISDIMLGINLEIIDKNVINPIKLLIECSPYMLVSKHGEKSAFDRDVLRAEIANGAVTL